MWESSRRPNSFSLSCSQTRRTHARANREKERDPRTERQVHMWESECRQRHKSQQIKREYICGNSACWTDTQTHRHTETQVKDFLASGVPPKGLELCVNFCRYRGFDAGKKGMVQCFVKGYGLMPNRWKWLDAGSKGII